MQPPGAHPPRTRILRECGSSRRSTAPTCRAHQGRRGVLGRIGARPARSLRASSTGWSPMDKPRVSGPEPFDQRLRRTAGLELPNGRGHCACCPGSTGRPKDAGSRPPDGFHERQVGTVGSASRTASGSARVWPRRAPECLRVHRPLDTKFRGSCTRILSSPQRNDGHGAPAAMAAIVDWEIGNVGDPKPTGAGWAIPGWTKPPASPAGSVCRHGGMLTRDQGRA